MLQCCCSNNYTSIICCPTFKAVLTFLVCFHILPFDHCPYLKLCMPFTTFSFASFNFIILGIQGNSTNVCTKWGCPGGSVTKNPPASAGDAADAGLILGLGESPGGENNNLLQYSCQDNLLDREAWGATVHRVTKNRT